ncbi:MAG: aspartate kinase, partial [Deltaproteobacteria bacterium]|nr:aspartate kinase [Deltaproteobacteria bacterium]
MIVLKFGGSSLQNASKIRRCISIVKRERKRSPLVVVSAHGDMTDRLIDMAQEALAKSVQIEEFRVFHSVLADSLRIDRQLVEPLMAKLETILRGVNLVKELTPKTKDHIMSFGERISAVIVAAAMTREGLPAVPVNAYQIGFVTDSNFGSARPLP